MAAELKKLLDTYKDKRVLVVAPPGTGKSTLLQHIPEGVDMDGEIFGNMPEREKNVSLQREFPYMLLDESLKGYKRTIKYTQKDFTPGDEESKQSLAISSDFLTTYINSHIKIKPGSPLFSTNVIDADVIIYLKLSDDLYKSRIESRNKKTNRPLQLERNFEIKRLIEKDLEEARKLKGVIVEEFLVN